MKFEPRISLVTLGASDMKKARKFYEDLGWKASGVSNERITFFQSNGMVLGLFGHAALAEDAGIANASVPEFRGVSLAYNCRSNGAVDEAHAHAMSCGATPVKSPEKDYSGGYSGYFSDPHGHLWEIAYNPFATLDDSGNFMIEATT